MTYVEEEPSIRVPRWTLLGRALRRRCPQCGGRGFFRSWFKVSEHCADCGLAPDREDGSFVGAVGFNTIFSFGVLAVVLLLGTWAMYPSINVPVLLAVCCSTAVVVPIIFWPLSQTLWMAFDLSWRPARAGELAPAYLATIGVDSAS